MSLLQCSHCGKDISATHKQCPHCNVKISFWREVKKTIEQNRLRQVALALLVVFLLGTSWYLGKNTGYRWPLYVVVILCAPVVPWLLQLAYKSAAPLENDTQKDGSQGAAMQDEHNPDATAEEQKIWRG